MERKELKDLYSKLIRSEVDALHVYDQMVPKVEDDIMRKRLAEFRNSHEHHVHTLAESLEQRENAPSEVHLSLDIKGYLLEGLGVLSGLGGAKSALHTLQFVEEMIYRKYSEAVSLKLPGEEHDLIRRYFSDVKICLDYITNNLEALS